MIREQLAESLVLSLEWALLVTAFRITLTSSVSRVIWTYRVQCLILAAVTSLTAYPKLSASPHQTAIPLFILVLPVALGLSVRWLLARATRVPDRGSDALGVRAKLRYWARWLRARATGVPDTERDERRRRVKRVWRDASEQTVGVRTWDVAVFVAIIVLAALVAFRFKIPQGERIGLTVALTLHLAGLYAMGFKRDLISQTVGLLVMDHGLYLAIVKIVALPVPALFFMVGLWFYTGITLFILFFLVPQVRQTRIREGIDLDRIVRQSDLKG